METGDSFGAAISRIRTSETSHEVSQIETDDSDGDLSATTSEEDINAAEQAAVAKPAGRIWMINVKWVVGEKLGIRIEPTTLEITLVDPENGRVAMWNKSSPDSAVEKGDFVIAVDNWTIERHRPERLLQQLQSPKNLMIRLMRPKT